MARRRGRSWPARRLPAADVHPTARLLSGPSTPNTSLLDVVDNLLNQGVTITGEVVLGIAEVDLIYLRISALFCAADRLLSVDDRRPGDRDRRPTGRRPKAE